MKKPKPAPKKVTFPPLIACRCEWCKATYGSAKTAVA